MCKPKHVGGMGFKDLISFNDALLAKHEWRIMNVRNTLLPSIFRAKYFPNGNFIDSRIRPQSFLCLEGYLGGEKIYDPWL